MAMKFGLLAFAVTLACLPGAAHAQIDKFIAASDFSFGIGDNLPAPDTQVDMAITYRASSGFIPLVFTGNAGSDEAIYSKTPGSLSFVLNVQNLNPTLPPLLVTANGTSSGQVATWTFDQTFSQTGGYPIQTSVDYNGTPVAVNLVVNNVRVQGSLRSNFEYTNSIARPLLQGRTRNRGVYTGGDAVNFVNVIMGTVSGTIGPFNITALRVELRSIQHIARVRAIDGTLNLECDTLPIAGQSVNIKIVPLSGGAPIESGSMVIRPNGQFSVPTSQPAGSFRLLLQKTTWLQRARTLDVSTENSAGPVQLVNGDVDGDHEIGSTDFDIVVANFGQSSTNVNNLVPGDIDRDLEVGSSDFDCIVANYGLSDEL